MLQAKPGNESNLLVVNKNGAVFSYIVKYRKKLNRLNYFIPTSKSIGNEKPIALDLTTIVKREDTIDNRTYYYYKFCSYLIDRFRVFLDDFRRGTIYRQNMENRSAA